MNVIIYIALFIIISGLIMVGINILYYLAAAVIPMQSLWLFLVL